MSNILKSTKLDIALVKPYFKTICFTLLLPIVFAAINRSLLTGVSFAMCFIAMTTGYTFSITEKNSMDRLFGILPVRKSELVGKSGRRADPASRKILCDQIGRAHV